MHSLRRVIPAAAILALTACSGSGGGLGNIFGNNGFNNTCQPGSQVQVVSPSPGQVNSNVNQITIVTNSQSDNIHPNPQDWSVFVTGNLGSETVTGGPLNPISDVGAPHPFTNDFYYQSQLSQTLPPGGNWTVFLQQNNSSCQGLTLQSFST